MSAFFYIDCSTTLILGITCVVIATTYLLMRWLNAINHFKKLHIPGPRPLPIIGNINDLVKNGMGQNDMNMINKYGKIVGYFEGACPVILTTDTDLIKNVLIKDFSYFVNRRSFGLLQEPVDKLLTVLKDAEWKSVRAIVTTTFTSAKLKAMSKTMIDCADRIVKHVEELKNDENINSKDLYGCYTLDVISSCCFGVYTDSINDPNSMFIKYLKEIFTQNITRTSKMLIIFFAPSIGRLLLKWRIIHFLPEKAIQFLIQVTEEVIRKRRSKEETRNDFIQMMIDHEENTLETKGEKDISTSDKSNQIDENEDKKIFSLKKTLTNNEILSQALIFLLGGYETSSTTLNFVTYHLAIYPECQKKLYEELENSIKVHGEIKYEMINELTYLEMVINETLRLYPPASRIDRVCGKDYEYNGLVFPKDSVIGVPIWTLHHDPAIYPEPEKFMPERFIDKPQDNVVFLPFGAGPRNCIGLRFAMLEMKIVLSKIVLNYEILKCDQTPVPLVLAKQGALNPTKPIFVKLKKRKN